MTVTSTTGVTGPKAATAPVKTSLSDLDQGDFLKLMLAQMEQQDPLAPVDQKEMLAQMAQFSSLAGTTRMADTLSAISAKLDTLVTSQGATQQAVNQLTATLAAGQSSQTGA